MVIIKITDDFIAANPNFKKDFSVNLGNEEGGVFGTSNGEDQGGYLMNVPAGSQLAVENEIFQVLVNNSIGGSFPRFLNNLLQYVARGVLEVRQDAGAALTKKQIMNYTAP